MIIDKRKKEVNVFELTVPAESRIKISHNIKYQKQAGAELCQAKHSLS